MKLQDAVKELKKHCDLLKKAQNTTHDDWYKVYESGGKAQTEDYHMRNIKVWSMAVNALANAEKH